jgi:hypothetical protein
MLLSSGVWPNPVSLRVVSGLTQFPCECCLQLLKYGRAGPPYSLPREGAVEFPRSWRSGENSEGLRKNPLPPGIEPGPFGPQPPSLATWLLRLPLARILRSNRFLQFAWFGHCTEILLTSNWKPEARYKKFDWIPDRMFDFLFGFLYTKPPSKLPRFVLSWHNWNTIRSATCQSILFLLVTTIPHVTNGG